jgi:hypothetical protein
MALGLEGASTKGWLLAASLLKYDLFLARRSFADAFATVRDRLLLALVTAFALLWLRDTAARAAPVLPRQGWMLAALAGPVAYAWSRAVLRRLAWLRESSVVAPEALAPGARLSYLACAQLPALAAVVAAILVLRAWTGEGFLPVLVALPAYAAGLASAAARDGAAQAPRAVRMRAPTGAHDGRGTAFRALLAGQAFDAERPVRAAAFLLACAAVATLAGSWLALLQPLAVRFAAALAPSVLLLAATARNAPEIVSLLAFSGYRARHVALSVCALPAANLAGVSAALLLVRPEGWRDMLADLALLHLLAALVATARAWLSPGRPARRVDLQVQLEVLALPLLASLFAPLVPFVAAWRLWLLHRHYSNLLWIQA